MSFEYRFRPVGRVTFFCLQPAFSSCRRACACRGPYFSLLRQRKDKQKKGWFLRHVSACWPSYFLLLRQKKVTKEKASQRPCPFGVPCATRAARGRAQTRFAQTSARPNPVAAALLSTANGIRSPNTACARSLRSHCTRLLARYARCSGSPRFRHNKQKRNRTHRRSRAKHQSIDYDRIVPQSGPTNPPRSAPIQKHLSKTKKPNWVFQLPFTPAGVKGRGGSGG